MYFGVASVGVVPRKNKRDELDYGTLDFESIKRRIGE